ncbi:ATP-binding protein [Hwanghaeella sp. 1Z406]|uniref:ATP-binding protein n=1 Tax=Hwanghaeella sp. 1Z406 TaxID=3402811 RepID=UPI003B679B49
MKLGLRVILALAFMVASIVPLSVWAVWVRSAALDREIEEVRDRHLLLARNLSLALERYAQDVSAVFSHVVETDPELRGSQHLGTLLASLSFRHICLIETDTKRVVSVTPSATYSMESIVLPPLDRFIEVAEYGLGKLVFTNVMLNPSGKPAIYLLKKIEPNTLALGELSTEFLRTTQRAVAFGEGGHAAIVDAIGRVVGHPRADWERDLKDLSAVDPVARMIKGETGVSKFFSPAAKEDMIAGFTTVPATGWGVMIPQPYRELQAKADEVQKSAYFIVAFGVGLSTLLGFAIGGFIAGPIKAVSKAADRVADGDADVSVYVPGGIVPVEVRALTKRFNEMSIALNKARQAEVRALRAAEEAVEAKSDFLTRVTHELRTPLNTVIGFSGMIRDQTQGPINSPEYVEYGRYIHDGGQRLLEMVNDIIAFSRVDRRGDDVARSVVDITVILTMAVEKVRSMAGDGQINVSLSLAEDLPDLWVDEVKFRQIISHLVTNAVKFTPSGGSVVIDAHTGPAGGVEIVIRDTGIGLSEEQIPLALSPFGQISTHLARDYEGAGLGLPLSKMLVEQHGGTLTIQSTPGQGTIVTVFLPPECVAASA